MSVSTGDTCIPFSVDRYHIVGFTVPGAYWGAFQQRTHLITISSQQDVVFINVARETGSCSSLRDVDCNCTSDGTNVRITRVIPRPRLYPAVYRNRNRDEDSYNDN